MKGKKHAGWMLAALIVASMSGWATAGEFQAGFHVGKSWLRVDASSMESGVAVKEGLGSFGTAIAYRWDAGAYLQLGVTAATNFDILSLDAVDHTWLAAGWQFKLREDWRFTPKLGVAYSSLEAEDDALFDDYPTSLIDEVIPFAELNLERRFGRHFGLGLSFRENFETWGNSRGWGLHFNWNW
jgi:hypothetical protein